MWNLHWESATLSEIYVDIHGVGLSVNQIVPIGWVFEEFKLIIIFRVWHKHFYFCATFYVKHVYIQSLVECRM